jgi:E3 ubiquitin-protein ligase SHPRH
LNLEGLTALLRDTCGGTSNPSEKGKKRAASESLSTSFRPSKRSNLGESSLSLFSQFSGNASNGSEDQHPQMRYPSIYAEPGHKGEPVFRHIFEIQYTTDVSQERYYLDDKEAARREWAAQEQSFIDLLKELFGDLSEPKTVDIGKPSFGMHEDSVVACSLHQWLLLVPSVCMNVDIEADDYSSGFTNDLLLACNTLKGERRANWDGNLRLVVLPPGSYDESVHELPFRLQLEVAISLISPHIFQPIPANGITKRRISAIEDAQRSLLTHIFPAGKPVNVSNYPGETNIPFFYSILGPAPRLKSTIAEDSLQPKALRPTLLPFQRRSVAWLLERETKAVTLSGDVVSNSEHLNSLPMFWDRIDRGDKSPWYIHRLTGTLSLELPSQDIALGGILAEEPGLGKTLECISLILLNPAPTRNPTVQQWDAETRINVKEIKVS